MPEISRFYGIVIKMYPGDHVPPHFHAEYGEHEILVFIHYGSVIGHFPPRKLKLVLKWLSLHREELMLNWHLCKEEQRPRYIEPLT